MSEYMRVAVLFLATFSITSCGWGAVDEFVSELGCGMSAEEVEAIATRYGAAEFIQVDQPDQYVTHMVKEGMSFVELKFGNGLETVRVGKAVPFTTALEYEPRVNLCTGERVGTIDLTVMAPSEFKGAQIYIDDEVYGYISGGPGYQALIGISTGPHEIRLSKEGHPDLNKSIDFPVTMKEATVDFTSG